MDSSRTRSFIMLNKIQWRCKGYNRSTIHFRRQGQISPRCREFKFRFKLLIFLLLRWPPFRRINILLQTLPTLPSSCHWSRQCCARLGFLLGMRLATVSHTKRQLQYKLENALSIEVDFQETFLSLQTTAVLDANMAPATLKREHSGAENHTTVFRDGWNSVSLSCHFWRLTAHWNDAGCLGFAKAGWLFDVEESKLANCWCRSTIRSASGVPFNSWNFWKNKGTNNLTNVTDMHDFISGFRWCKSQRWMAVNHNQPLNCSHSRQDAHMRPVVNKILCYGFLQAGYEIMFTHFFARWENDISIFLIPWGDDGKGQQCLPFGPGPFRIRQGQHQQRSFSRHSCANVPVQFLRFIRIYRIWSTQRWCVNLHKSHRFSWNEMKSCHVVKGRRRDSDAREAGYLQMHCQRESSSLIGTLEYIENMNMTSMTMTMFWIVFGGLVCASQFEPNLNLHASSH